MHRPTKLLTQAVALLAASWLSAGILRADDNNPPPPAGGQLQVKIGIRPNGKVSKEEFLADNQTDNPAAKAALEQLFERGDTDKDGSLSMDEVKAMQGGGAAKGDQHQVKIGIRPNGKVSKEEFLADNQTDDSALTAALEQLFDRADTDKDGSLSMDEAKAMQGGKPAAPAPKTDNNEGGGLKLPFDAGGKISREAFLEANKSADPQMNAKMEMFFNMADTNKDGSLTVGELMAIQQKLQEFMEKKNGGSSTASAGADDEPAADPAIPAVSAEDRASTADCDYAVVISATAAAKPEWKAVADALVKKHNGKLVTYDGSVVNALPQLTRLHPRYTAFVARPEIVGRLFVARIHRITRMLNDDPYTDTIWGIVSASTPEAALRMAEATEPKVLHSAIGLTGINHGLFDEALTLSDAGKGNWSWKKRDGTEANGSDGDADRTRFFVEKFKAIQPELIVGSGHATEANLEMPFSRGNTECRGGKWYGLADWRTAGETPILIEPDNHPRVFVGAGNCLIGNFQKRTTSMAATLIGAYNVNQFVGYTVPTWYGKGGWGTLGLWCNLPGTYSLAEAWFFNNQAITEELRTRFPESAKRNLPVSEKGHGLDERQVFSSGVSDKDEAGMLWDRDVVAFYGDPAQRVLLDGSKHPHGVSFALSEKGGVHSLDVAIAPTCTVKGGLICLFFPKRIPGKIKVVSGGEYQPLVTENFIILQKADYTPGKKYSVTFRAAP